MAQVNVDSESIILFLAWLLKREADAITWVNHHGGQISLEVREGLAPVLMGHPVDEGCGRPLQIDNDTVGEILASILTATESGEAKPLTRKGQIKPKPR